MSAVINYDIFKQLNIRLPITMGTLNKSSKINLFVAWAMSLMATLASIYFIEIVGNPAATLCWFERMLVFSVFVLLTVAIVRKDTNVRFYIAPLVVMGAISATFQQLVHWDVITVAGDTCSTSIACVTKFFELFGFITQATLCLTAFVVVGVCMYMLDKSSKKA